MKKYILIKAVYILGLLILLTGCKARKEIFQAPVVIGVPVEVIDNSRNDKLNSINNKNTVFNTLSVKAKADLSINKNNNDVNMNFRIRNNEAIWVSVTAIAGLEVARALITPDSVKILNRLENEYIKKPFSYIYEFTNERISFGTLQSILTGNTMAEFINDSTDLNIQGGQAHLKSVIGSLIYNLHVDQEDKVLQTILNDDNAAQELTANYGDFLSVNEQQVPHSVLLNSKAKNKNIKLDLKYSKVEMNGTVEMPFRVPDRFLIKN